MKLLVVLACAATGALGFGAARALSGRAPPPASPRAAAPLVAPRLAPAPCASGVTPADLQALKNQVALAIEDVKEEKRRRAEPEPEPEPVADPDAEARATEVIERSLLAGAWTEESAQGLRDALIKLGEPQRRALLARLVTAINDQKLRVDMGVSLF